MHAAIGSTARELLIARARACIGVSKYRRNALLEDAPMEFNCFRFTQWLYRSVGVSLPDHQLLCSTAIPVLFSEIDATDLVFIPRSNYSIAEDDFGHVGIATGLVTVIHATKRSNGVVEELLSSFTSRGCLGVRRVSEKHYCRL